MDDPIVESILKERYYQPGESSWEDIAKRVAKYVSDDIGEFNDFYEVINEKKFIPNTPALMNAGTENPMLFACISGDTLVYTIDGLVPMKDIKVGDLVLTHTGNFKKVKKHWSNGIKDTIELSFGKWNRKVYNLRCTPDHKILSDTSKWESANEIVNATLPSLWKYEKTIAQFDMLEYLDGVTKPVVIDNNYVKVKNITKLSDNPHRSEFDRHIKSCYAVIKNVPDVAFLFGAYLSNGNIDGNGIRFCINKSKMYDVNRICSIIEKYIGITPYVYESNHGNWVTIRFDCIFVKNLLIEHFGYGFAEKSIPIWIAGMDNEYLQELLNGIMLDGSYYVNKTNYITGSLYMANPTLVYQTLLLCRKLGYFATFTHDTKTRLSKHDTSGMRFANVDNFMSNIVKRAATPVEVFDMEVEDDHSFIAGDFVVHNCYALGADDSIESIFETMKVSAKIMKLGGGIGIDWSHLRPEGALVHSTHGTSSGVIAFMRNFNEVIETVKSGGRRRGAGISILDVEHGDVDKFITCKNIEGTFANFNISVKITDHFMQNLDDPVYKNRLHNIATAMWTRSEPGILFIDTAKNALTVPLESDEDLGVNPCGEQTLVYNRKKVAGECCNLGSMNMVAFYDQLNGINYKELERVIRIAVRYLDNSIDKSIYPTPEIEDMAKATRRIGLGEMGWADLFIKLGIRYGSQESLDLIDKVKSFIKRIAEDESEYIARKKGSFPKHNVSKFNTPRRNAAISTEAPTGSLSLFAGVSSGIEPVFSYIVERKNSCGTGTIVHQDFMDYIKRKYDAKSVEYIIQWVKDNGTIQNCPYVDDETKHIFVTALDISPVEHINVQATFQKYTDASISKTLNLPESTTVEQIVDIIRYAWEQKLKGLTIYRQNSRDIVVYDINKKSDDKIKLIEITNPVKYKLVTANGRVLPKTPREMPATLVKKNSGCGKMMIAIGEAFGGPHSVTIVNKGGCDAMTQALAELTALALRWGIPGTDIVKTLKGIKCSAALKNPNSDGKSCPDILGKVIDELYEFDDMPDKKDKAVDSKPKATKQMKIACPECGESLIFESGCVSCSACGYSRCG